MDSLPFSVISYLDSMVNCQYLQNQRARQTDRQDDYHNSHTCMVRVNNNNNNNNNNNMGGSCEDIIHDVQVMKDAEDIGLSLNAAKCEIVCDDMTSCGTQLVALPGAQLIKESQVQLLGSPLGDEECISVALAEKVEELQRLGKRLQMLTAHDALVLLRNSFSLPKLLYILRTAPCFRSATLETYDDCLREILGGVTSNLLERDSQAWVQATLPVKLGGLGIQSAVNIAPSAFLASVHSSSELVDEILPPTSSPQLAPFVVEAKSAWSAGHVFPTPEGTAATKQIMGLSENSINCSTPPRYCCQ